MKQIKTIKINIHQLLIKCFIPALLFLTLTAKADNYFWVGGTGNWSNYSQHWATSSGGNVFHTRVPSPNDTVVFDTLSFVNYNDTVHCDSIILTCYTMRWEQQHLHPVFRNAAISNSNILKIYGSLLLDTGLTWAYTGKIYFESIVIGNKILSAGRYIPLLYFRSNSGGWALQDSLSAGKMIFSNGFFYTNNQKVNCNEFRTVIGNGAQIFLGESDIYTSLFSMQHPPLSLDADSATIYQSSGYFWGGNQTYNRVVLQGYSVIYQNNYFYKFETANGCIIKGSNIFDTLYSHTPGSVITLLAGTTQTVNDSLILNGNCDTLTTLEGAPEGYNANFFKNNLPANVNGLVFDGISSNNNINCNYSIPLGNATGWNILSSPSPRILYWVGGSGNWSDAQHWSTTSGGSGGNCAPNPLDDVFFDAQSFANGNDTVKQDLSISYCQNMDWTGATLSPQLRNIGTIKIWGSLTFINQMTVANANIRMRSNLPFNTITNAGHSYASLTFNGYGNFHTNDVINVLGGVYLANGNVFTNGNNINCGIFSALSGWQKSIDLTNVTVNCAKWDVDGTNTFTINTTGSIINMSTDKFGSNNQMYNIVNYAGKAGVGIVEPSYQNFGNNSFRKVITNGKVIIWGGNTFDTLQCNGNGFTITLDAAYTQTINNQFTANGICAAPIEIKSTAYGSAGIIFKNSGNVTLNYVILEDVNATGGANFTANLCCALTNVTGWNVIPIPNNTLYWIGGSGNWGNPAHWSLTSGGTPNIPQCVPWPVNDAIFDAASYINLGDATLINVTNAYCKNIDWSAATLNPNFTSNANCALNVFASFTLNQNMTNGNYPTVFRSAQAGNTINTATQPMGGIELRGIGGDWTAASAIVSDSISLNNGTFNLAGQQLNTGNFISNGGDTRTLLLDTAQIRANNWLLSSTNLTLDADSASITLTGTKFNGANNNYLSLLTTGDANIYSSDSFKIVVLSRIDTVMNDMSVDSLVLNNAGMQLTVTAGKIITINNSISTNANSGAPLAIECMTQGSVSYFKKLQDTVCLDFIEIRDVDTLGGAVFFAGLNGSKSGNANGWLLQDCNPVYSNVWPGDAGYDTIANNFDLLKIGIAYNETGTIRPNASLNWVGQPCPDWNRIFTDTTDIKHADCDGSGIVDMNDTLAVSLNYNSWHAANQKINTLQSVGLPLYIDMPYTQVVPGQTVTIPIKLGTAFTTATNVYGIAFTVTYQQSKIAPGSMSFSYNNSWLIANNTGFGFAKNFFTQGETDFAITRINHTNATDTGEIASITLTIDPNASGALKMFITDIKLIDANENEIDVQTMSGSMTILGISEYGSATAVNVFPNPSSGQFILDDAAIGNGAQLYVYDALGNTVQALTITQQNQLIDISQQPKGIYIIKVITQEKVYTARVVIE
jgi:hypothetical protein